MILWKQCKAFDDVLSRSTNIAMAQGDDLGARSGARGVKHQGDIIRLRKPARLWPFLDRVANQIETDRASF